MRQQMHDDSDPVMAALARISADGYATDEQRTAAKHAYAEITALRARLETVEAKTRERLSNELDPEIGLPSDARLRNIHADLEMRGRKHPDFAVTVHHRNIVLSAVAAELRNLEPRHD